jgi:hypothetical protein
MKTTQTNTKGLRRRTLFLTVLGGLLLVSGAALPNDANAEIRVRARIVTPNLSVRVGTPAPRHPGRYHHDGPVKLDWRYDRHHNPRPLPFDARVRARRGARVYRAELTLRDQRIANYLMRRTSWSKFELLELRRDGNGWFEVGRILNIRPALVHYALAESTRRGGRPTVFHCGTR